MSVSVAHDVCEARCGFKLEDFWGGEVGVKVSIEDNDVTAVVPGLNGRAEVAEEVKVWVAGSSGSEELLFHNTPCCVEAGACSGSKRVGAVG